jgi:hypothetical protein
MQSGNQATASAYVLLEGQQPKLRRAAEVQGRPVHEADDVHGRHGVAVMEKARVPSPQEPFGVVFTDVLDPVALLQHAGRLTASVSG